MKQLVVCAIVPYFLERENAWIEKNIEKLKEMRKWQKFFAENILFLSEGLKINLSFLGQKIEQLGYERVWKLRTIGEFSLKGGMVEIFPVNSSSAWSVEFSGNKIEKIRKLNLEIKNEKEEKEILKENLKRQNLYSEIKNLKEGEFVVHLNHGIGIYRGKKIINKKEYYQIDYKNKDRIFVPLGLERKISRYLGFEKPIISNLQTNFWQKTKKKVKKETERIAQELLEIYKKAKESERKQCLPDDEIIKSLEQSFPFTETPDQEIAFKTIKEKLEKEKKPIDILVCGDPAFGKTEIALRAMAKYAISGFQSLLMTPTTILAYQHFFFFKERLKNLPFHLALLTKKKERKEEKEVIKKIREGKIEMIIGTHRILSSDLSFKNLGLLIIDDEHKFGVKQKEKMRKLYPSLDMISLSATPIPRTLFFALSSLKEIILLKTPPLERKPAKVFLQPFSFEIVKKAIEKELKRKGQVFYLHNEISSIEKAKNDLEKLFERKVKFEIIHRKLKQREIIKKMVDFQQKKIDVLLTTTIIEAGIDFPNANTMIVKDSARLGLSQLYQLKGRVGRSFSQGFVYFLYPKNIGRKGKKRLRVLKKINYLGAGY
ncbi:MAG: DEAD/DEAH box helicase, partial [Minisyncoccales bacterium]